MHGPLVAAWADNAVARAGTPQGCTPSELLVGIPAAGKDTPGSVFPTSPSHALTFVHAFGRSNGMVGALCPVFLVDGGVYSTARFVDCFAVGWHGVFPSGISLVGGWATIHEDIPFTMGSLTTPTFYGGTQNFYAGTYASGMLPGYAFPDVMIAAKTTPASLTLVLGRREGADLTLATPLALDSASVTLADASGLPASGTLLAGSEIIEYAARNGNVLNGLRRALYGTAAQELAPGSLVQLGEWYVRVNNAMLKAGATKPGMPA